MEAPKSFEEKAREDVLQELDRISKLLKKRREEFKGARNVEKIPPHEDRRIFEHVVAAVFYPLLPFDQYPKSKELKIYKKIVNAEFRKRKFTKQDKLDALAEELKKEEEKKKAAEAAKPKSNIERQQDLFKDRK